MLLIEDSEVDLNNIYFNIAKGLENYTQAENENKTGNDVSEEYHLRVASSYLKIAQVDIKERMNKKRRLKREKNV